MSKPCIHAESTAKRFGGRADDYMAIENFLDSSKQVIADNRHRLFFHSTFGIFLAEKLFGQNYQKLWELKEKYGLSDKIIAEIIKYTDDVRTNECSTIRNSAGKDVSTREIAEQHVLEDFNLKFIPTPQDYFEHMEIVFYDKNDNELVPRKEMSRQFHMMTNDEVFLDIPYETNVPIADMIIFLDLPELYIKE